MRSMQYLWCGLSALALACTFDGSGSEGSLTNGSSSSGGSEDPSTASAAATTMIETGPGSSEGDGSSDGGSCPAGTIGCPCDGDTCTGEVVCTGGVCGSPTCGDGRVDPGEECDDRNDDPMDGCNAECRLTQGARQVTAGGDNTCAVIFDGAVRCWGDGANGRTGLGHENPIGDDEPASFAPDVGVGAGVLWLATGPTSTCAVLESGRLRCWGVGANGRLGQGSTIDIGDDEAPALGSDVELEGTVLEVAVGHAHACALLEGGDVACWGSVASGRLGYGRGVTSDVGDDEAPAAVGLVEVGQSVVQVVAGEAHTCVLLTTGGVRCWGDGGNGRLGYGSTTTIGDDETPDSAGDLDLGGPIARLVAGARHTCAVRLDGQLRCWGVGGHGRLGTGSTEDVGDDETPLHAGHVHTGGQVVDIAAGAEHTCILVDLGAVRCFGRGADGRLGYAATDDLGDNEDPAALRPVMVGGTVVSLTAGRAHTCARLDDGSVRCWGAASSGQLGHGNTMIVGDDEHPSAVGVVPFY